MPITANEPCRSAKESCRGWMRSTANDHRVEKGEADYGPASCMKKEVRAEAREIEKAIDKA